MEPRTLPKGPCEAQQAPEERHSASDDAHSALLEAPPKFSRGFPSLARLWPTPNTPSAPKPGTLLLCRYPCKRAARALIQQHTIPTL